MVALSVLLLLVQGLCVAALPQPRKHDPETPPSPEKPGHSGLSSGQSKHHGHYHKPTNHVHHSKNSGVTGVSKPKKQHPPSGTTPVEDGVSKPEEHHHGPGESSPQENGNTDPNGTSPLSSGTSEENEEDDDDDDVDGLSLEDPNNSFNRNTSPPMIHSPQGTGSTGLSENEDWDVIVVGGGATGIIAATLAAEAGKKTLLLDVGGPSLYRDGARVQSEAWKGTEYALHDLASFTGVGLSSDSKYFQAEEWCKKVPGEGAYAAPCILGGGTAVNAQQQLHPPASYFDTYWPEGWKSGEMAEALVRVEQRLPSTPSTSADQQIYFQEVYELMGGFLTSIGGQEIDFNKPEHYEASRHLAYGHQMFVSEKGQRGGPMTGYLPSAQALQNFKLQLHTEVTSLIREGSRILGVNAVVDGQETTYFAKNTILSAGVFGTSRILFSSGIGPQDVLQTANSASLLSLEETDWILNDAIGRNLHDNAALTISMTSPKIVPYDFSSTFETPNEADKQKVISEQSGPITIYGRTLNWWFEQQRSDDKGSMIVQSICSPSSSGKADSFSCQFNLNEGAESRSRVGLGPDGSSIYLSPEPWYSEEIDLETYAAALSQVLSDLRAWGGAEVTSPDCTDLETCKAWIAKKKTDGEQKGNRHWGGTAKIGEDDATQAGGTSAVDLNLKVYGTDNLFIVDASLSPAPTTSNPACLYEAVVEHGMPKILAQMA